MVLKRELVHKAAAQESAQWLIVLSHSHSLELKGARLAQWVRHWTSSRKVPDSFPVAPGQKGIFLLESTFVRLCRWCVLGKGTLPPFPTLSDESLNRGLVCVARTPSSTDFKDPNARVLDGWMPATATHVLGMHMTPKDEMRLPKMVEKLKTVAYAFPPWYRENAKEEEEETRTKNTEMS